MKNLFLLLLLFSGDIQGQDSVRSDKYVLGMDTLTFHHSVYYPHTDAVSFINLHDDENTSVEAGLDFLSTSGGTLMQLQHSGKRIFYFYLENKRYGFDPNRIFTSNGIRSTLEKQGNYNEEAADEVRKISDSILLKYVDDKKLVVALHNNTKNGLSILSYKKGGFEANNTAKLYINRHKDPHDFVLTTDRSIFNHLKHHKINVVLQHPQPEDDGSLSVYAARKNISYINIEALHGHFDEQVKMLEALKDILTRY